MQDEKTRETIAHLRVVAWVRGSRLQKEDDEPYILSNTMPSQAGAHLLASIIMGSDDSVSLTRAVTIF